MNVASGQSNQRTSHTGSHRRGRTVARAKKTPILDFRPDDVIRSAERIEDIIRADRTERSARPD